MGNLVRYQGTSKIYDLLDIIYFKNNEHNPRRALLDFINKQDVKILDICTGTAANAIIIGMNNKNARITGIDKSPDMLRIADAKVKLNELTNIDLLRMDATRTAFDDSSFDVIIISLVLHEVSSELARKIITEAKRVLKPEGKLLILEWEEPQSIYKRLKFYLIRKMEPVGFERFLKMDMENYFKEFGLKITGLIHCDYSKVLCLCKSL